MDELRARLERISSIREDPLRTVEHLAFRRLLYRNRNQHRRGLYFRRLEHVRRLLNKINESAAWGSIRLALNGDNDWKRKQKHACPLSLSTITLMDMREVEALNTSLVFQVIPKTAVKVTEELICRRHFLPFAVTMLALLARIFAIEQKLLTQLRGAIVETKLLLGMNTEAPGETGVDALQEPGKIAEDVGEDVAFVKTKQEKLTQELRTGGNGLKRQRSESPSKRIASATIQVAHASETIPKNLDEGGAAARPSLYELMADHDVEVAQVAVSRTRGIAASQSSGPTILNERADQLNDNRARDGAAEHERSAALPASSRITAVLQEDQNNERISGCEQGTLPQNSIGGIEKGSRATPQAPDNSTSSESEDLDDIFDALDN